MAKTLKAWLLTLVAGLLLPASLGCKKTNQNLSETKASLPEVLENQTAPKTEAIATELTGRGEIDKLDQTVKSKNYDAAVGTIIRAQQGGRLTEEQRKKIADAQLQLIQAAATDEKARQAYQELGRVMMGR